MHAVSFNADISEWDVSSVTDASRMFYGATSFKTDISNWNVSSMVDVTKMVCLPVLLRFDICYWLVLIKFHYYYFLIYSLQQQNIKITIIVRGNNVYRKMP